MNTIPELRFETPELTDEQQKELAWLADEKPELTFRQRLCLARMIKPAEGNALQHAFNSVYSDSGVPLVLITT